MLRSKELQALRDVMPAQGDAKEEAIVGALFVVADELVAILENQNIALWKISEDLTLLRQESN